MLALIRCYKLLISPYFYGSCRFVPSCADYASEAVLRHGALAGGWLALKRLARCHPLFNGGLDSVPTQPRRLERTPRNHETTKESHEATKTTITAGHAEQIFKVVPRHEDDDDRNASRREDLQGRPATGRISESRIPSLESRIPNPESRIGPALGQSK